MVSLVTGANGFLGGYVRSILERHGEVVSAGRPEVHIPSEHFDSLLRAVRPDLVVHCAGPASVPNSIIAPDADFEASVTVTFELLERLRRLPRLPSVIFLSSAAVYGDPPSLPVAETETPRPISPYGYHKLTCELLLEEFRQLYGLPSASLRVFSAYGEGLRRQILWDVCVQALTSGEVRMHGTGAESRDFLHARDVAAAVSIAVDRAAFEAESYNVASGVETTTAELAELAVEALGVDARIQFTGVARHGDPSRWRADIGRMVALGFEPAIALRDGVRSYAAWASRQLVHA